MTRGRPRIPEKEQHSVPLSVRFTREERERLARVANAAGLSLSEWCRRTFLEAAAYQPKPKRGGGCFLCGGICDKPCVDNSGTPYMGCRVCRFVATPAVSESER